MLALGAALQREIARPYAEPVYFLELVLPSRTPGSPPLTLRLSDRYIPRQLVGVPTTGVIHEALALIQDFGVVEIALNPTDAGGAPTTAEPVFLNTTPIAGYARLGDVDADYEFAGARATLSRLGLDTPLAVLYVEEPADVGDTLLRLRMSDITLAIEDRADLVTITRALFPFAHPDAIDRTIPIAIGSLDRVPALYIDATLATTLAAAAVISETTLTITDGDVLPAPPFTVQVDGEARAVSAKSATSLTIDPLTADHQVGAAVRVLQFVNPIADVTTLAMGAGATNIPVADSAIYPATPFLVVVEDEVRTASILNPTRLQATEPFIFAHASASPITAGLQSYRYVLCENRGAYRIRAVPTVYNRGVRLTSGFSVNLDDRDLMPGRSFVSITLGALPSTAVPPVLVDIVQLTPSTVLRHGTNVPVTISRVGVGSVSGTVTVPAAPAGTVTAVNRKIVIRVTSWGSGGAWTIERQGGADIWTGSGSETPVTGTFFYGTGATYDNEVVTLIIGTGGSGTYTILIDDVTLEVEVFGTIKSGDASLVGSRDEEPAITASIEGIQDDDLGSITGAPRTLLERPGHVMRFLTTAVYGVPLAELGPRWAATIIQQAAADLRWAFLLGADGPPKFSDVRALAGEQSNSRVTVDHGLLDMVWRPTVPAADLTLDYERDIWSGAPATLAKVNPTQRFNRVVGSAQRDYAGDAGYRYTVIREDLGQPGFDRPVETTLELPWVQAVATADYLVDTKLREVKMQPRELALIGYQALLGLQTVDHVRLINHPGLAAHGGAATLFRVIGKGYELGFDNPARIRLAAIEAVA